jgi:alkylglycerol monooxygenase
MVSGLQEQIITFATPAFFVLIAIELVVARLMRRRVYYLSDAISSIGLGVLSQITGVFTSLLRIGLYAIALDHVALIHLSASDPWVWVSGVLLYDLCYYWLHRAGHEVNLLWAAHVVHHQSEHYNLSTALRQTSSGALFGWIFYLPMALLGFPLKVFVVVSLIDLLYQFWIHTELIGSLGWFDRVFASPSNHRVHHAVNERYLDRNYGGILILWDRLFGTFEPEQAEEPCIYGTRSPLRSFNPLWANLEVYAKACRDCMRATTWRERVAIWFRPPGWQSEQMAVGFPMTPFDLDRASYRPPLQGGAALYAVVQFAFVLMLSVYFLGAQKSAPLAVAMTACAYLALALFTLGAWLEQRHGAAVWEGCRVGLTAAGVVIYAVWRGTEIVSPLMISAFIAVTASSLVALWRLNRTQPDNGLTDELA